MPEVSSPSRILPPQAHCQHWMPEAPARPTSRQCAQAVFRSMNIAARVPAPVSIAAGIAQVLVIRPKTMESVESALVPTFNAIVSETITTSAPIVRKALVRPTQQQPLGSYSNNRRLGQCSEKIHFKGIASCQKPAMAYLVQTLSQLAPIRPLRWRQERYRSWQALLRNLTILGC